MSLFCMRLRASCKARTCLQPASCRRAAVHGRLELHTRCPAARLLCAQAAPHVSALQAINVQKRRGAPHVVALQAENCAEPLLSVSSAGTLLCMACWKRQTSLPSSSMWVAATAEAASTHHSCCAGSLEVGCLHMLRGTVTRSRAEFHRAALILMQSLLEAGRTKLQW